MCRADREMDRAGKSVDEIVRYLEAIRSRTQLIITLDTLDYARRSGRVGTLQMALASVLNVKPIAVMKDGLLDMAEKVRTRKAAIERVIEIGQAAVGKTPVHVCVAHARDLESGKSLAGDVKKHFNVRDVELTDLSVSLAVQFGPGALALILYPA